MNAISLTGSLWAEFRRRYATRSLRHLNRGLKPTATIIWSLRDRACRGRAGRCAAATNGRKRRAELARRQPPTSRRRVAIRCRVGGDPARARACAGFASRYAPPMKFPRHWAKAAAESFECWRWSDVSAEEARVQAETAVRAIAERARNSGGLPDRYDPYGYPDRPLREELLRQFRNGAGELTAAITRNASGCQVLNTARAMFVDVDFPEPKPAGLLASLKRLFAPAPPQKSVAEDQAAGTLAKARAWVKAHPGWCWRAYRTRAGLRLLATHALFEPKSPLVEEVFEALGSDALYRRLCKAQESFRARLTPKPWRCGIEPLRVRWPWADSRREAIFKQWEEQYRHVSAGFATCRLVAEIGEKQIRPELQSLVEVHDQLTRIDQPKELA